VPRLEIVEGECLHTCSNAGAACLLVISCAQLSLKKQQAVTNCPKGLHGLW
jgi:hypothetical protein